MLCSLSGTFALMFGVRPRLHGRMAGQEGASTGGRHFREMSMARQGGGSSALQIIFSFFPGLPWV